MRIRSLALLTALAACDGNPSTGPDAGPTPDASGSDQPVIGGVAIIETRSDLGGTPYRYANVSAQFYDGEPPRWHRDAMAEGACVLRTFAPSQCTPDCPYPAVCLAGTFEALPSLRSAGRLTVEGLRVAVAIDPMDGYYYLQAPPPENLFDDGAAITARLAGAAVPAVALSATGVPPLATQIQDGKITVPYPAGQPATIRWTPSADPDARVRLTLNANNQGHGLPYLAILECDAPDRDGRIDVPAALLDAFPDTRAWTACAGNDCPPSWIRRYHRTTHAIGAHDIELVVGSEQQFGVDHIRN